MTLDRIHNTLKVSSTSNFAARNFTRLCSSVILNLALHHHQMFCVAEPSYDKSLQQLQSFLSGLISEEKLEMREGLYVLKK